MRADVLAREHTGLPGQADDPLDLVRQAQRLGFARLRMADTNSMPTAVSSFPALASTSAADCEQPADADLPHSEHVEQHFVSFGGLQSLGALVGSRVEQAPLPGLGGSAGEPGQRGTLRAGWSSVCRDC
jgi:hypothetical protein